MFFVVYADLHDFTILVGNNDSSSSVDNFRCLHKQGPFGPGRTELMFCDKPRVGQYVFLVMSGNSRLTFCEIKIYKWHGMFEKYASTIFLYYCIITIFVYRSYLDTFDRTLSCRYGCVSVNVVCVMIDVIF